MISAGRVLLMPKGAYNPITTYEMLDIVSYNGSSYIAKGTTTGNLPTDTTYWQLSAYGGQAANVAGNFAELEISSVASMTHYADDIFVDENSQLMKATQTINIGDTIDVNTNCTPTTVEALITSLSDRVDSLESTNRKLQGAIEIAAQTDLHSLALGEYYKSQTSFYVTNAPVGINQVTSAEFRLTVEAALDNASQASSPLLLTLRTPDGKIFTQGYNGSAWSTWEQSAAKSAVDTLNSEIQTLTNQVKDMNNVYGSKNLLPFNLADIIASNTNGTWSDNKYTVNGITFTFNDDGSVAVSGSGTFSNNITLGNLSSEYIGTSLIMSDESTSARAYMFISYVLNGSTQYITDKEFIIPNGASDIKGVLHTDTQYSGTTTIYPMIRLASIEDNTYEPYAKTNQQLTEDTTALLDNLEVNGAVNMLDFTHASEVRKGYTFTNTDGVVTVTGSRASGETGNADHYVTITLPKGTYKVSGCPSGGSDDTWRLLVNINSGAKYAFDYGDGAVFTLTEESSLRVYCSIMANYSDTVNLTFYPMITVPSYNGDYVPYAKSNKELTEELNNRLPLLIDSGTIPENSSKTISIAESSSALYRLTLGSIGADSCGRIVIFGKHPSVANIRYATFDCVDINASYAATISVSGSSLTITSATNSNCMYTLEKIQA